jgi:hypothetical protein
MGLEPTTATLATWRSTTELHPQQNRQKANPLSNRNYKSVGREFKRRTARFWMNEARLGGRAV